LKKFKEDVQDMGTKILQAALALHERVSSTFRKTAINFHYEFTVRHLANVFQVRRGIFQQGCQPVFSFWVLITVSESPSYIRIRTGSAHVNT